MQNDASRRAPQYVYVGLRRRGVWNVMRAEQLVDADLTELDLLEDFQSTRTQQDDLLLAKAKIALQAAHHRNPFQALVAADSVQTDALNAIDFVWKATSRMMNKNAR